MLSRLLEFRTIENVIKQKTRSLINEDDKNNFRNVCFYLANYLIANKNPPRYYELYRVAWKGTLYNRLKDYYKKLDKHGGCPLILEEKDKNILELKYEQADFCEKKNEYLDEIQRLKGELPSNSDKYLCRCNEYNEWIEQKKKYFEERSSLFGTCYQKTDQNKKKRPSEFICDLTNPKTFEKISDCQVPYKLSPREAASDISEKDSQTKGQEKHEESTMLHESPKHDKQTHPTGRTGTKGVDQDSDHNQNRQKPQQELDPPFQPELQTHEDVSSLEFSPKENEPNTEDSLRSETLSINAHPDLSVAVTDKSASFSPAPLATKSENSFEISLSSPTLSTSLSSTSSSTVPSEISGTTGKSYALLRMLKKKKKIKKKYVKFLRILVPSSYTRRSEHLAQGYLEHPKYGDEEIIKKIKIHECNMIKKVNTLNQKNERTKTIIEVHLEVLEAYRKEEWECKKGEFLEICLDVLTKERYGTHSNLTNDDLIMKNVKSCGHIEKQKILWNKWIERHKNISDKFKKVDWFNNLKNDWKKEKSYIKEMEELKNKSSNEYQNILFLEREKDVWRRWISEKGKILKQYIDQNWFKELSELNQNMLDEYKNEEKANYVSLINIEELEHGKNYEELYKYIKTKLLSKLCILVLMTILEECKKEDYIEDRELHLDSSINERKIKKNSEKIPEISDKFIEKYSNVYENSKNSNIHNNIEENFREEMNDWIGEEATYVNSIESVSNIDKYYNSSS
ncbi:hypothetical protein MKS88_001783 [Plasmodium brasilianum]|uniref:Uncharacterized protein n=1 Tax=Plasmodium brasilianum TaxID=5824 RepID=A0ACB9YCR0_PLABR|nr:hypothetical protein MKS88_001783 [Plasmodium brasilianum]